MKMQRKMLKATLSIALALCLTLQAGSFAVYADTKVSSPAKEASEPYPTPVGDPDYETFKEPPIQFRSRPLFFWNTSNITQMSDDKLRQIVDECYKSGYSGFGILPYWQGGYMSETYLHKYRVVLEQCAKYDMKLNVYDENGFPSGVVVGGANGSFLQKYPNDGQKVLNKSEMDIEGPASGMIPIVGSSSTKFMGISAFNKDTYEMIDISESYVVPEAPSFEGGCTISASGSSYFLNMADYAPDKAFDNNSATRWNAGDRSGNGQWLQADFNKTVTVDKIVMNELYDRVLTHHIEYWDGAQWQPAASGGTVGSNKIVTFSPITTDKIRIVFDTIVNPAVNSISFSEIQFFSNYRNIITGKYDLGCTATASSTFAVLQGYGPEKAIDGNYGTRWNAGDKSGNGQWLQLEFDSPVTFNKTLVSEGFDRVTSFHIEYWNGTEWVTIVSGGKLGSGRFDSFETVTASKVRLVLDTIVDPAINSVTIWEFQIFNGTQNIMHPDDTTPYCTYNLGEGNWKIMTFTLSQQNNDGFCDYMDPEAVKHFIELTHEVYYDNFEEYFGNVIDMTFYDEPAMWRGNTWTGKYNEKFEAKYGFSPVKYYPALYYDVGPDTAAIRNMLWGFRADLFADGFIKTIQDWCTEHNIKFTGHTGEEEIINPTLAVGDLMKSMRDQDIPGIDEVIFYQRISRALKVVSSIADNWNKQQVMCEILGATVGLDIPTIYRELMDHFTKGINVMVPHAVWYDENNVPASMVPELSWRNSYYGPALPAMNDYVGRASYMLQGGRLVADIGVVYPIAAMQGDFYFNAGYEYYKGGITPRAEWNYMDIGEMLSLNVRRDFTYLHPDVIDDRCTVEGDTFKLNNPDTFAEYKVIIIPGGSTISYSNLLKIKQFYDNGGVVLGTKQLPYLSAELGHSEDVQAIIKEMFGVDPKTTRGPIHTSSSQYEVAWDGDMIGLEPWKAGDKDYNTRWQSVGSANQWLAVDFGHDVTVSKVVIDERNTVSSYKLQYWDSDKGAWADITTGTTIGKNKTISFDPVASSKFRLLIPTASSSISVNEFDLFDANGNNLIFPETVANANGNGGKAYFLPNVSAAILQDALDKGIDNYDVRFPNEIPYNLPGGKLSYIHKVRGNTDIFMVANSSDSQVNSYVDIRGEISPVFYDPHTGLKSACVYEYLTMGDETITRVKLNLKPVTSIFIISEENAANLRTVSINSVEGITAKAIIDGNEYALPVNSLTVGNVDSIKIISNDPNYDFAYWNGDFVGTANPLDITLPKVCNLYANFKYVGGDAETETVTLSLADGFQTGASVKINGVEYAMPYEGTFAKGTEVVIDAVPVEGRRFAGWAGDINSVKNPTVVVLNKDISALASIAVKDIAVNYALGKPVTSNDTMNAGDWNVSFLTNGVQKGAGYTSSKDYKGTAPNQPIYVEIDLGENLTIDNVVLWPRTDQASFDVKSHYFPEDFKIMVKADGSSEYTTVADLKSHPDVYEPQTYEFEAMNVRYVRIEVTKMCANKATGDYYRFQLAEVEIMGRQAFVPVQSFDITTESKTMSVGETIKLSAVALPDNADISSFSWYIHDANGESYGLLSNKAYGFADYNTMTLTALQPGTIDVVVRSGGPDQGAIGIWGVVGTYRITIKGAPTITSVTPNVTSLVSGCAANVSVSVDGTDLDDCELSVKLFGKEAAVIDGVAMFKFGAGEVPSVTEPALHDITVLINGQEQDFAGQITIKPNSADIYAVNAAVVDGKLLLTFNTHVTPKNAKFDVVVAGVKYDYIQSDNETGTVLMMDCVPNANDTIVIKNVKMPELFPSYSFTFTTIFN